MKRTPPRRTVADRMLQNVNGIVFELEQMKKQLEESAALFSASDRLLLERGLEKLEAESEKLTALLSDTGESADPFTVAS